MLYILLQAAAQKPAAQGSMTSTLIMFGAIFLIMYFLMIRPQQKKQKETQQMLSQVKVNDKVLTSSGMYGRVTAIKPDKDIVTIEIDDTNKVRVDFQKGAIVAIISAAEKG